MLLSVVIPTHARPRGLRELLASLEDQDFPRDQFEVHVIANLEGDPGEEVAREFQSRFAHLHWHVAGAKGANRARNVGLAHAQSPILFFLDDDCVVPHRYYFRDILEAHEKHPEAAAIGGGYFAPLDATPIDHAYNHTSYVWLQRRAEADGAVVNLVGGNVSYKRALLGDMKFKDEIEFGGAETEFHLRLYRAGLKLVYIEELRVEHRARVGGWDLLRKGYKQGRGAHARWLSGLHVPTRLPDTLPASELSRTARWWKSAFDRAFALGGNGGRPRIRIRRMKSRELLRLALSLRHRFWQMYYRARFARVERKPLIGLPLQRFYVLPVSESCRFSCEYCPALGMKKLPSAPLELELERAVQYDFKEVLIPCNWSFHENIDDVVKKVEDAGLRPSLLINGDQKAEIDLDKLKPYVGRTGFHLLLGPPSDYLQRVLTRLFSWDRNFTATFFPHREQLKTLSAIPSMLANRVHYLFPAEREVWHPLPNNLQIYRLLDRVRRAIRNRFAFTIRGPAGWWPSARVPIDDREAWPLLKPAWQPRAPGSRVKFSIVIPTYNSGPHLVKVLRALGEQTVDPESFEVIVGDDGSRDATLDMLKLEGMPCFALTYFHWPREDKRPLDFRAGLMRNLAASHARGEYLCFLDSDILVPPNYLEHLEHAFEDNDVIQSRRDMLTREASQEARGYSAFTGADIYPDDPYWEKFKGFDCWAQVPKYWKYTCTYALAMRRDLFRRAGWFSPEFFTYGYEDVDLGYRLAKLGARFHLSQNTVYHLYPERSEHNYHFDANERARALTLSVRVFYRNRLDPEIFNEFYASQVPPPLIKRPLRDLRARAEITTIKTYWSTRSAVLETAARIQNSYWKVHPFLAKPYYVARYQYDKRIRRATETNDVAG